MRGGYGLGGSPERPCPNNSGRSQRGRDVKSRAFASGFEYNYFFLNPLADISYEDGVLIPYAEAAILSSNAAFNNPLAEDYNNGDDFADSPPDSPRLRMLSPLAFQGVHKYGTVDSVSRLLRTPTFTKGDVSGATCAKTPVSPPHHDRKAHRAALTLSPSIIGAELASPPQPPNLTKQQTVSGLEGNPSPGGVKPPPTSSRLSPSEAHTAEAHSPTAHEPHAPHTPPLNIHGAPAGSVLWRRFELSFPQPQLQQGLPCEVSDQPQQLPEPGATPSQLSPEYTAAPPQQQLQQQKVLQQTARELLSLQAEKERLTLLAPRSEGVELPQTPLQQPQRQRSASLAQPPPAMGLSDTLISPTSSTGRLEPTEDTSVTAIAAADAPVADSAPLAATTTANCSGGSFIAPPACQLIDAAAAACSVIDVFDTATAQGAASPCPDEGAEMSSSVVGGGGSRQSSDGGGSSNNVDSAGGNGRWLISDGPQCSISGLAMTRVIIRQLGLLPPGVLASD